jgi:hypothetical protein
MPHLRFHLGAEVPNRKVEVEEASFLLKYWSKYH